MSHSFDCYLFTTTKAFIMQKLFSNLGQRLTVIIFVLLSWQAQAGIFIVSNTNPFGFGSFNDAILNANFTPGKDTIVFNIAGAGPHILNPNGDFFPRITDPVFINGYSQPGSTPGPIGARSMMIVLNGTRTPGYDGLTVQSNDVTIAGLVIRNFDSGIRLNTVIQNVHIWGCYFGTDTTGNVGVGNLRNGVWAIADFTGIDSVSQVTVGTNGDGFLDLAEGNLIGSCGANGIQFTHTKNGRIAGNVIGIAANGLTALANGQSGIRVETLSTRNTIGSNSDGVSDQFEANAIGNSSLAGIWIANASDSNSVRTNVIGLGLTEAPQPNNDGIIIQNCRDIQIGTNSDGVSDNIEGNLISGNTRHGIYAYTGQSFSIYDRTNERIQISGNRIGSNSDGTMARPNGSHGVYFEVFNGYNNFQHLIGSNNDGVNDVGEGNIIAFNGGDGITTFTLFGSFANVDRVTISRNSIYENAGLGIDLSVDKFSLGVGVTPNDNNDVDDGPNGYLNAPVITNVVDGGTTWVISGFSRPGAIIEIFNADAGPNPNPLPTGFTKSFGEGQTFYARVQEGGTLNGITDNDATTGSYTLVEEGNNNPNTVTENRFEFAIAKTQMVSASLLTATATDALGNTSEFGGGFTNATLPVQLLSFNAVAADNKVTVLWKTAREVNADRFEVMRSADGREYVKIGLVAAGARDGEYRLVDNQPLAKAYYKLKQIDKDGRFEWSKAIYVQMGNSIVRNQVKPNPFIDNLTVSFQSNNGGSVFIRIIDQLGRPTGIYPFQALKGLNNFNISGLNTLKPGNYYIEVIGSDFRSITPVLKAN
jgi:hypothetical protein